MYSPEPVVPNPQPTPNDPTFVPTKPPSPSHEPTLPYPDPQPIELPEEE